MNAGQIKTAIAVAIAAVWLVYALSTKPGCPADQTAFYRYVGWYCATRQ